MSNVKISAMNIGMILVVSFVDSILEVIERVKNTTTFTKVIMGIEITMVINIAIRMETTMAKDTNTATEIIMAMKIMNINKTIIVMEMITIRTMITESTIINITSTSIIPPIHNMTTATSMAMDPSINQDVILNLTIPNLIITSATIHHLINHPTVPLKVPLVTTTLHSYLQVTLLLIHRLIIYLPIGPRLALIAHLTRPQ